MLHGHGGEIYTLAKKLGISPDKIIDHSSNVSPLPPPKALYDILAKNLTEIEHLPEVDSETLREALAKKLSISPNQILVSSGTTDWIFALPRIIKPKRVLILAPTYADYSDASYAVGANIDYFFARPEDNFQPDLKAFQSQLYGHELIFICNPNNPTGTFLSKNILIEIISYFDEITFVVDESYLDFIGSLDKSLLSIKPFPKNLVVLRSFSKIYRIPGLRLGYAVAGSKLVKELWKQCLPWSVNRLAQIAGLWLLNQDEHIKQCRELVQKERKRLIPRFKALPGVRCFEGHLHFFLLYLENHSASKIWERLLREYFILTRNASNFKGLNDHYLRISLRSPTENDRLIKALEEVLKQ